MHRILIVDDEVIVRKWLSLVFQPYPDEFEIAGIAANGAQAYEICTTQNIDIIITDLIMPDMDGISFIQQLRNIDQRAQIIILSNLADFPLAKKGMSLGAAEYLLKGEITEEELLGVTRTLAQKLRTSDVPLQHAPRLWNTADTIFLDFFKQTANAPAIAQLEQSWVAANRPAFFAIVCSSDFHPQNTARPPITGYLWSSLINRACEDFHLHGRSYILSDLCIVTLIEYTNSLHTPLQITQRLVQHCNAQEIACSASFTPIIKDIHHVPSTISQAMQSLTIRFYQQSGAVIAPLGNISELPPRLSETLADTFQTCQQLIANHQFTTLQDTITQLKPQLFQGNLQDISLIQNFCAALIQSIQYYMNSLSSAEDYLQLFSEYNTSQPLRECLFLTDLLQELSAIIQRAIHLQAHTYHNAHLNDVVQFLQKNYHQTISVQTLSQLAGFSPNYLCNIFKTYTGQSIKSYLTDLRIKEAKHQLAASNHSIAQIAENVGYDSVSYFIKVFKDAVGVTPHQFRAQK